MIRVTLPRFDELHRLRGGAVVAPAATAVFRIEGSGALTCLQGLWTNDVAEPGDGSLSYGALLTPKGMIITDGWALRSGDAMTLLVPLAVRDQIAQLLKRSIPPRLAIVTDLSESLQVLHLLGDGAIDRWPVVPLGRLPEPGSISHGETADGEFVVAVPSAGPFQAALLGPEAALSGVETLLRAAGMSMGGETEREAARVLASWPALGVEIDERTLPQEVRFDEHDGVSYTKGCYTGQETVARLHFRGHANRILRGLRWVGPETNADQVLAGEKLVGRVGSVLTLPDRVIGLAILRREIHLGNRVTVGGAPAVVVELPFSPRDIEG